MKFIKPHLKLHKIDNQLVLDIDTYELKDIIEDYLIEECDIEYEYYKELSVDKIGYRKFRLYFSNNLSKKKLIEVLEKYSDEELIKIVKSQ